MQWLGPYVIKKITDGGVVQFVKMNRDPFLARVNGSWLKPYTGDLAQWIHDGRIVLLLQTAARNHETTNYTTQLVELRDRGAAWKNVTILEGTRKELCYEGIYRATYLEMTIIVTIHDLTARRRLRGVGLWNLRHLRLKYLEICLQINIYGRILGGKIEF